jgi:hypothetical protein
VHEINGAAVRDGTTYECRNTCEGTFCDSIYGLGKFGSIWFMCEGDGYRQVDAVYTFLGGKDGSCGSSSSTRSWNFHVGRLGVLCPIGIDRDFVYDDTFGECRDLGALGTVKATCSSFYLYFFPSFGFFL